MVIDNFVQSGRREAAIQTCFDKLPSELKNQIKSEIDVLLIDSDSYVKYDISQEGKSFRTLIAMNAVDDLSDSALIGLVAHLFALYSMGYDLQLVPKGDNWLSTDLYSDNIARDWGFQEEVDDLRKVRPQRLPQEVEYQDIVIEHSALSKQFEKDISSALIQRHRSTPGEGNNNSKVWYIDKFSMLCSPRALYKNGVQLLHIFTNNYRNEDLNQALSKM